MNGHEIDAEQELRIERIQERAMSHTYAVLEVSHETFEEVYRALEIAGYQHAFHEDNGRTVIDMHGVALAKKGESRGSGTPGVQDNPNS